MCQNVKQTASSSSSRGRSHGKTSLSGGKVRKGRALHGTKSIPGDEKSRARSRSRTRKEKVSYDTPFDEKGRCNYHKSVQLASKKMSGGWKVMHSMCPKCMEDADEDKSVRSSRSHKSSLEQQQAKDRQREADGQFDKKADGQFDKNGCCILHSHIQVAKKKVLGGWKVIRTCPVCEGKDVGLDDDDFSVCSGRSAKSTKSTRSTKSSSYSKGKRGEAVKSGKYGALPFDGEGYCCLHPSVRIAKKKAIGGWKIIHSVCPDCAAEKSARRGGSRHSRSKSRSRSKSQDRRRKSESVDDNASVASYKSGKSGSSSRSSSHQKRRIRVKNLRTEDESGKPGKYWGYVDKDYRPNGQGAMKYEDGTEWEGVWCEGSRVNGKLKRASKVANKPQF